MNLLKARFIIKANGRERRLFSLSENKHGDVYIRLYSGVQVGLPPHHVEIRQHRYSIHPSLKSGLYTTIKKTIELEDGESTNSVAMTNAVKSRIGFCPIFNVRFSTIKAPCYDVVSASNYKNFYLGEIDTAKNTLVSSLLISSRVRQYPTISSKYKVDCVKSRMFRLTILTGMYSGPSTDFTSILDRVTSPAETADDPETQQARLQAMNGLSIDRCEDYFDKCLCKLAQMQLDELISTTVPGSEEYVQLTSARNKIPVSPFLIDLNSN